MQQLGAPIILEQSKDNQALDEARRTSVFRYLEKCDSRFPNTAWLYPVRPAPALLVRSRR